MNRELGEFRPSGQQVVLRALIFLAPLLALLASGVITGGVGFWTVATTVMLAAAAAVLPDTHLPAVLLIVVASHWCAAVDDVRTPWTLLAAGCMLAIHVPAALVSTTPASATFSAATLRRWGARTLGVAIATTLAWLLALVVQGATVPASVLLFVVSVVAMAALVLLLRRAANPD